MKAILTAERAKKILGLFLTDYTDEEIARIICVADCYDAMSSNRCYRKALSLRIIREEILRGRGTQFDPVFADIMLAMIDEDTRYRMRET